MCGCFEKEGRGEGGWVKNRVERKYGVGMDVGMWDVWVGYRMNHDLGSGGFCK